MFRDLRLDSLGRKRGTLDLDELKNLWKKDSANASKAPPLFHAYW
jgi:hypothetical protein